MKSVSNKFFWRYRGLLYTLICSVIFSLSALCTKKLENVSPFTIAIWRFQGALVPGTIFFIYRHLSLYFSPTKSLDQPSSSEQAKESHGAKVYAFILLRAFLTCNSMLLHFYSLKYLELGDALVIFCSKPIVTYALGYFLLGEECGVIPTLVSMTTLLGVGIITKPPALTGQESFDLEVLHGAALALVSMLLSAGSYVTLRHLRKVHFSITMITFGWFSTLENLAISLALGVFHLPNGQEQWLLAGGMIMGSCTTEILCIMALKAEEAGPVALVRSLDVVFGFCWQVLIFRSIPDIYSLLGAFFVVLGVVLTGLRKWVGSLPEENETKRILWFFLK